MTSADTDDALLARMDALITGWQATGDRRVIFLGCYRRMTANMRRAVVAGRFNDGAWVTRLIDHFAGYYFRALDAYDRGSDLSQCWQRAFDETRQPGTTVIQQLLMGVSAHISCDLVLVLDDLLRPVWAQLSAAERELRLRGLQGRPWPHRSAGRAV